MENVQEDSKLAQDELSEDQFPKSVYDFNPQQCMNIIKSMSLKGVDAMDDMDFMEAVHTYIVCSGRYIQHLEYRVAALDKFVADLNYCFSDLEKGQADSVESTVSKAQPLNADMQEAKAVETSR